MLCTALLTVVQPVQETLTNNWAGGGGRSGLLPPLRTKLQERVASLPALPPIPGVQLGGTGADQQQQEGERQPSAQPGRTREPAG